MLDKKALLKRIVVDPAVMVGKPVVKGTRLTVQHVLGLLAQGMSVAEIIDEYPNLSEDDISACLFFASEALENVTFAPLQPNA